MARLDMSEFFVDMEKTMNELRNIGQVMKNKLQARVELTYIPIGSHLTVYKGSHANPQKRILERKRTSAHSVIFSVPFHTVLTVRVERSGEPFELTFIADSESKKINVGRAMQRSIKKELEKEASTPNAIKDEKKHIEKPSFDPKKERRDDGRTKYGWKVFWWLMTTLAGGAIYATIAGWWETLLT